MPGTSSPAVPSKRTPVNRKVARYLNIVFQALEKMGSCLEHAKHTSTFLGTVQCQWEVRRQNRMNTRMSRRQDTSVDVVGSRKCRGALVVLMDSIIQEEITPLSNMRPGQTVPRHWVVSGRLARPSQIRWLLWLILWILLSLCNVHLSEGIPCCFV